MRRRSLFVVIFLFSCLDPYVPQLDFSPSDILVVDGLLNASDGTAAVKLSRTQSLGDTEPPSLVAGATVTITSSAGIEITLNEHQPGSYSITGITVTRGEKYHLTVITTNGREFYSDPVVARATPPIDSVTLAIGNDNTSIDVRVNSRDPSGDARYFTWEYVETYEYTAAFSSGFTFENKIPKERAPNNQIYRCWRTVPSSSIGIVTTRELTASVIHQHPIINLPRGSIKLSNRYSVLVKQRVVSSQEYNYLGQLKKTTESLGGLFDPQPSLVIGNIHERDQPGTAVLGYFSASEVTQLRIFMQYEDLPKDFQVPQDRGTCQVEYTCDSRPGPPPPGPQDCVPIDIIGPTTNLLFAVYDNAGYPYSFGYAPNDCSDCRIQGGITTPPDFW